MGTLRANASFSRKVNLGNYETADYSVEIVGLEEGMTAEEMEPLVSTVHLAWDVLMSAVDRQIGNTAASKVTAAPHQQATARSEVLACHDCGDELKETRFKDGTVWAPAQLAAYARRKHGRVLCMTHYREANDMVRRSQQLEEIPF